MCMHCSNLDGSSPHTQTVGQTERMSTAAAPDTTGVIEKHKDGNDKSEHITHLDNVVRIIIIWSECNYRISENADISTVCW